MASQVPSELPSSTMRIENARSGRVAKAAVICVTSSAMLSLLVVRRDHHGDVVEMAQEARGEHGVGSHPARLGRRGGSQEPVEQHEVVVDRRDGLIGAARVLGASDPHEQLR